MSSDIIQSIEMKDSSAMAKSSDIQCTHLAGMEWTTMSSATEKRHRGDQEGEYRNLEPEEPPNKRVCTGPYLLVEEQGVGVEALSVLKSPKLNINDPISQTTIANAQKLMPVWVDELLSHNGSIVQGGYESSFAVQSLLYLRTRWYMRTEGKTQLPLQVASWIWDNKLLEICNGRKTIFACRFCEAPKRTLDSIFAHFVDSHPDRCRWEFLEGDETHSSRDWNLALWPEFLPIDVKFEPQLQKSLRVHMVDVVYKLSELDGIPKSILIYLWFRLSLEWQIKTGKSFPSLEKFINIATTVQKDTNHPMFSVLRCGGCGARGSMVNKSQHKDKDGVKNSGRYEKPWMLRGLYDHYRNQHGAKLPWKELLICSPTWEEVMTSCFRIEDKEVKRKFISLWRELDEGMASKMQGTKKGRLYVGAQVSEYSERKGNRPESLVIYQQARLREHTLKINPNPGRDWGFIYDLEASGVS